ncbi:MAG: hypothetical protein R6U41_05435 [Desulfosalsimonas sp.]|uniref:hypothetical protein n=1 Tax=Desulfosalsimonas sp. TaxID=3073848 RepID=UPI003970B707
MGNLVHLPVIIGIAFEAPVIFRLISPNDSSMPQYPGHQKANHRQDGSQSGHFFYHACKHTDIIQYWQIIGHHPFQSKKATKCSFPLPGNTNLRGFVTATRINAAHPKNANHSGKFVQSKNSIRRLLTPLNILFYPICTTSQANYRHCLHPPEKTARGP